MRYRVRGVGETENTALLMSCTTQGGLIPGGDIMELLMKEDTFPIDWVRFYIAEVVVAVATVHSLDYIQ